MQHTIPGKGSVAASVVHDKSAKGYTLFLQESAVGAAAAKRTVADSSHRAAVPGPAHSVHFLHRAAAAGGQQQQQQQADGGLVRVAVVLQDGRVGVTDAAAAEPLALLPAPAGAGATRHLLATSAGATLAVLSQPSAGAAATLRVLRLTGSASADAAAGVSQARSLSLACPGGGAAHAVPVGLTLSPEFALVQWSNGHATAVHGLDAGQPGAATAAGGPLRPVNFPLCEAVGANGASSSGAAAAGGAAGGRKRKNAAAPGGADGGSSSRPRVLCAAVDGRQFVVLDLESGAAQSRICYSLHDAQYGCPLDSGSVDVDAPLLSLDPESCAMVGAAVRPDGAAVVRLGGAVHVLTLRPPQPVSLLSLVARLSVSAAAAAGKGGKEAGGGAGRGVAAELAALPAPVTLDASLLAGAAGGAAAAATAAAAAAVAAATGDDSADVLLAEVPASAVTRGDDICNSLIEQLAAALAAAAAAAPAGGAGPAPPAALQVAVVKPVQGRRQHGREVPAQLLSLAARALAAARQWQQLGALLLHVPPGGLAGCSEVLAAAAATAQYGLLPRLCTCLDDVEPGALVAALAAVLAPTTKATVAARKQHYDALRASAEARVAEAELAACGGSSLGAAAAPPPAGGGRRGRSAAAAAAAAPPPQDPAMALALAQCAAAAVDGWSYREVLLHPLLALPVDAPAVQVALRALPAPAVDALLGYCAKWVGVYTGGGLGELAAGVVLPQELLFPYLHQVREGRGGRGRGRGEGGEGKGEGKGEGTRGRGGRGGGTGNCTRGGGRSRAYKGRPVWKRGRVAESGQWRTVGNTVGQVKGAGGWWEAYG